ncbi:hypothetical protein AM587_10008541 [Phytophthora nicotianae]|uniref:Helitron helicase-like domain-containing protein n=1 Tax=Phytophthora nicotianae TaxID=4792 RepID=A0A0W8CK30_PHYNI|nr:hypothetical protein AM587_10008541 [Phytophthora nicotianae]
MNVFIGVVLNWDQASNVSKPGFGLFGRTVGFFASTESQNSTGDLHNHMLIWIDGMPRTIGEYYDACQSLKFRSKITEYVASIVKATYPITDDRCPHCNQKKLQPIPVSEKAFCRPLNGAPRSCTSKCTACRTQFGANEVIEGQMRRLSKEYSVDPSLWSGEYVQHKIAMPDPLPLFAPHGADIPCKLLETAALLRFQTHYWFHSRSCFKHTRRTPKATVCRMFFPKDVCGKTECG